MEKRKCILLIICVTLLTSFINIFVGAQNIDNSKIPLTSFTLTMNANATVSPNKTSTPETNPFPVATPSMESDNEWFALETKKISVRVGKTKNIKIAFIAYGNWIDHSKKRFLRDINKGYFKFKSNKPQIAKVTKKGVIKGIKKGNAKIKVTLRGATEPQYCKVKVFRELHR